jgi:hypothetical protein
VGEGALAEARAYEGLPRAQCLRLPLTRRRTSFDATLSHKGRGEESALCSSPTSDSNFKQPVLVVPANAGTHTPRTLILSSDVDAFLHNEGQGLWVPAFAGTTRYEFAFSRHTLPEVLQFRSPKKVRGRGECRVSDAPVVGAKNAPGSRHRFTGFIRHSLRNGFTGSFALSLVTGLCCHHRRVEEFHEA